MKFNSRILVILTCVILVFTFLSPINVQATAQSAPTNFTAKGTYIPASVTSTGTTIPAKKGIELRWTAPSLAQKYEIHRSTSASGPFIRITTIDAKSVTYFDTNINIGVAYYYKIRAYHTHLLVNKDFSSYTAAVNAIYAPVTRIDTNPKEYQPVIDGPKSKISYTTVGVVPYVPTFKSVKFTSSNSGICSVDSNGVLTGKSTGTATITITSIESPTVKTTVLCSPLKYLKPAAGNITSQFGVIRQIQGVPSDPHTGIDFSNQNGLQIVASRQGTIKVSGFVGNGGGLQIIIDHGDGIWTGYYHLSETYVSVGQKVVIGQQIAKMGMTGISTGVHLHFEVIINGKKVNPLNYINMNSKFICTVNCR